MKKIILLMLVLTITTTALFTQNSLNPKRIDGFNFSSTFIDRDYNKHKFLRGLNWGNTDSMTYKLDNILNLNSYHAWAYWWSGIHEPYFNNNPTALTPLQNTHSSYKGLFTTTGLGIYLEPALEVDSSSNFVPNSEADYGAVFGFQSKSSGTNTIVNVGSNTFGCYSINKSASSGTILSNIWKGDLLHYGNFVPALASTDQDESTTATKLVDKNGVNWKLSINLRSSETFPASISDTSVVLKLKIPYKGIANSNTMSGFIRFGSMPRVSGTFSNDVTEIYGSNTVSGSDFRGLARNSETFSSLINYFDITVGMLRTAQADNSSHSFITLNAGFICDSEVELGIIKHNPFLAPLNTASSTYITSVDVEVEYFPGILNLDINWVRIGTPNLEKLVNGAYDYMFLNDLGDFTYRFNTSLNSANGKISRFYSNDEMIYMEWEQFRYMNLLLDTLLTTETFLTKNVLTAPHFYYGTGINELWNGVTPVQYGASTVPFVRQTNGRENPNTFGLWEGYGTYLERMRSSSTYWTPDVQANFDLKLKDTLNSLYETIYLTSGTTTHQSPFNASISEVKSLISHVNCYSVQQNFDNLLLGTIYEQPYAYYEKPYISNMWIDFYPVLANNVTSPSTTQSVLNVYTWSQRPKTGEEFRLNCWSELIKGSKGLMIYQKNSPKMDNVSSYYDTNGVSHSGTLSAVGLVRGGFTDSSLTGEEMIYSDLVGGDFIKLNNDPYSYDKYYTPYSSTFYDYNTMQIRKDRMYIGMKSMRNELNKVFSWTTCHEPTLLKLNLIAYKNKGYVQFANSKPSSTYNINQFIDADNICTRPIGRTKDTLIGGITQTIPYYENSHSYSSSFSVTELQNKKIDSAFYEVSILKHSDKSTDEEFYIGIQNRRTDPLLYFSEIYSSDGSWTDDYLKFYTTTELDKNASSTAPSNSYNTNSVVSGTITCFMNGESRTFTSPYPQEFWQYQYWQRIGCREITIPFKYKNLNDTNNYRLLEVEELADTTQTAINLRNSTNTTVVKTVIGQDGLVKLNMLPGEGKLLKVRVIQPSNNLDGILDYSNQNKLICMKSLADTSKIRYFATYYKHDTIGGVPTNRVYFATSQTISKEAPTEQIQWNQPPILLSGIIQSNNIDYIYNRGCDYPSIVSKVINDSLINHYVVFQCKGEITNLSTFIEEIVIKTIKKTTPYGIREFDTLTTSSSTYIGTAYYQDNFSRNVSYKDYGNPVISAIDSGVVTAWSSSQINTFPTTSSKIQVRYHDDAGINTNIKNLTINHSSLLPQVYGTNVALTDFRHPSFNSYSLNTSFNYKNYSTLVWQQINPDDTSNSYISMTHIKLVGGNLVKYLPRIGDSYYYNLNNTSLSGFGTDTSIIQFKWGARAGNLPAVYKTYGGNLTTRDYLVWERHWSDDYIQLYGVVIENVIQSNPALSFLRINKGLQLSHDGTGSGTKRLSLPNLGTPSELLIGNYNYIYNANSANLNFNYNDKMLHTSFLGNSIIGNPSGGIDDKDIANNFNEIANGKYPHLSNSPFNNTYGNTWRNRRIFNEPDKIIKTSARYFYKTNNGGTEINKFVGFANDTSKFSFCDVFQNGNYLNLNTNSTYDTTFQETDYSSSDSIYSDWFTVGTSCNVEFIYKAVNYSGNYHVYIQRRDSNSNTTLTMVPTSDNSRHVLLNLINGNGHEYRLCVQSISNAKYLDEVVFGSLNGDTLFLKGSKQDTRTISLSQGQNIVSKVYPNPASEELFVEINKSYDRVREMTLELYDQVGKLYQVKTCRSGEKVKIDIQNYPKGSYYLNLKGYLDGSETSETIKFEVLR